MAGHTAADGLQGIMEKLVCGQFLVLNYVYTYDYFSLLSFLSINRKGAMGMCVGGGGVTFLIYDRLQIY